jgi:hypothetical protein
MGESRVAYRGLVVKPDEKRPLGRPKHRWDDNIKGGSLGSGMGRHGLG